MPGCLTPFLAERADPWDRYLRVYEATQATHGHQLRLPSSDAHARKRGLWRLRNSQGLSWQGLKPDRVVCFLTNLTKSFHPSQARFLGHSGVSCSYFGTDSQERTVIGSPMGPDMLYSPGFAMRRESLLYKTSLPWKHGDNQLISHKA